MDLSSYFNSPEMKESLQILGNNAPNIQETPYLARDVAGGFAPNQNTVYLNNTMPELYGNTLPHEYTHAVLRNIAGRNEMPQLTAAYNKIMAPSRMPIQTDDPYRKQPNELLSFGVGNMVDPSGVRNQVNPHVDATGATEMAILRELALRKPEKSYMQILSDLFK